MFMSAVEAIADVRVLPELAGARILLTGLSPALGMDVARAFADNHCRLVLAVAEVTPEITAMVETLAASALDIKVFTENLCDPEAAVRFAKTAAQAYGGLDVVINLVPVSSSDLTGRTTLADIEALVSEKLLAPTLLTRIVANRMRVFMTEGLVLNVVMTGEPRNAAEATVSSILRAALAALTRGEAAQWADQAVRINAVGPRALLPGETAGACLASESDLAALALHLAGKRGRNLSGHVFDAHGATGCL